MSTKRPHNWTPFKDNERIGWWDGYRSHDTLEGACECGATHGVPAESPEAAYSRGLADGRKAGDASYACTMAEDAQSLAEEIAAQEKAGLKSLERLYARALDQVGTLEKTLDHVRTESTRQTEEIRALKQRIGEYCPSCVATEELGK